MTGCSLESAGSGPSDPTDPPITGDELAISGEISQDATWEGAVRLVGETVIKAGVTVTVAPGTVFTANQQTALRVSGTFSVEGTPDQPVSMTPAGDLAWTGIVVEAGGSARIANATGTNVATLLFCHPGAVSCTLDSVQFTALTKVIDTAAPTTIQKSRLEQLSNGGITVRAGGDVTVTDTTILVSTHDLVITSGGRFIMDHSEIGATDGTYDHCAFHFGAADEIRVTNSNIVSSVYGIMIGGTSNAKFNNNNFIGNDNDVLEVGVVSNIDMTGNFWDGGAPNLGPNYNTGGALAAPVPGAGPRL